MSERLQVVAPPLCRSGIWDEHGDVWWMIGFDLDTPRVTYDSLRVSRERDGRTGLYRRTESDGAACEWIEVDP